MGYIGYSESENSAEAKVAGIMPASHLARKLGVKIGAIRELLEPAEWHHTSAYFNRTDFYDSEIDAKTIAALKAWRPPTGPPVREFYARYVNFESWAGTRRRPERFEITVKNVRVKIRGQWATISDARKRPKFKPIRKHADKIWVWTGRGTPKTDAADFGVVQDKFMAIV